ncbi:MAG: HD domain-containing protein [Lachnotalea sp.]
MTTMEKVNAILRNEQYITCISRIRELEENRIYCKHNMEHFMDVARIAYIMNLEHNLGIDKKIIYTTALLHDIGRQEQYEKNVAHEEAGARIAREILKKCDFEEADILVIIDAIALHGDSYMENEMNLNSLLYKADKLSRFCFSCHAKDTCNWDEAKKNMKIQL